MAGCQVESKYYTVQQVAEMLQLSPKTIQRLVGAGVMPHYRLRLSGQRKKFIRISEKQMLDYLEGAAGDA